MAQYLTAEVCLNGHSTTDSVERSPERRSRYCSKCGAETITECPNCLMNIRGRYYAENVLVVSHYTPPNYCHGCGTTMPWTKRKMSTANELIEEMEELSKPEQDTLKQSVLELTRDTPQTELASFRYKKILKKSGKVAGEMLNKILVSIATSEAKKLLGLS